MASVMANLHCQLGHCISNHGNMPLCRSERVLKVALTEVERQTLNVAVLLHGMGLPHEFLNRDRRTTLITLCFQNVGTS